MTNKTSEMEGVILDLIKAHGIFGFLRASWNVLIDLAEEADPESPRRAAAIDSVAKKLGDAAEDARKRRL